jgi:hypothetical protein
MTTIRHEALTHPFSGLSWLLVERESSLWALNAVARVDVRQAVAL